jgi:hypothetical protein
MCNESHVSLATATSDMIWLWSDTGSGLPSNLQRVPHADALHWRPEPISIGFGYLRIKTGSKSAVVCNRFGCLENPILKHLSWFLFAHLQAVPHASWIVFTSGRDDELALRAVGRASSCEEDADRTAPPTARLPSAYKPDDRGCCIRRGPQNSNSLLL